MYINLSSIVISLQNIAGLRNLGDFAILSKAGTKLMLRTLSYPLRSLDINTALTSYFISEWFLLVNDTDIKRDGMNLKNLAKKICKKNLILDLNVQTLVLLLHLLSSLLPRFSSYLRYLTVEKLLYNSFCTRTFIDGFLRPQRNEKRDLRHVPITNC